jgi:FkbH-like protein
MSLEATMLKTAETTKSVKCVVWDLDNTLWDGTLLEDEAVRLKPQIPHIIKTLDGRGILQSLASKNDPEPVLAKLREYDLEQYFLCPQISWNSKSASIVAIADAINIAVDSLAFIDDQEYELEEVRFSLPGVLCINASQLDRILSLPAMNPRFITEDSKDRRLMYLNDRKRQDAEETFIGPREDFLATLEMEFTIAPAREEDLQRAEELTVRTHQLNTTGYTYSFEELKELLTSDRHHVLIAGLTDKFGSYGKIGLSVIECDGDVWTIKLLLMSCRVMSRGVGTIFMSHIMSLAQEHNARLRAEFIPNGRNRMMYVTYKFANFKEVKAIGDKTILENDLSKPHQFPDYVRVNIL